jgi:hypothetical protein
LFKVGELADKPVDGVTVGRLCGPQVDISHGRIVPVE